MISDSVELWDTVSYTSNFRKKCSASKDTQDSSWGWFRVIKIASKIWVLENRWCDECKKSTLLNFLSRAWVHFVTDLASLFTDHKMSGLPIRAKSLLKTICEQTFDNSPTDSSSSCLTWSSKQGLEILKVALSSCFPGHCTAQRIFLSMSFHVVGPCYCSRVRLFPTW